MQRTILVTKVENQITKEQTILYGRYDPVTLNRKNLKVIESAKCLYTMDDKTFAKHGTLKEALK